MRKWRCKIENNDTTKIVSNLIESHINLSFFDKIEKFFGGDYETKKETKI
jgi:hypothetical protein